MGTEMPRLRPRLLLIAQLAARELWHDRKVSLCIIASLVAVIAPLLLLFGLKYGVISQLNAELLGDPRNLEIRMQGNHDLGPEWFADIRVRPGVGFVMPLTRSLNTQADLMRDNRRFVSNVELIPSGAGDPLLDALPPPNGQDVLLSASAASRLGVEVSDTLRLVVLRKLNGRNQRGECEVRVAAILPASRFPRPALLLTLDLLVAVEDFRDGFAVPVLGFGEGQPPPPRTRHARARIYSHDLDHVADIAAGLERQQIQTITRSTEIEAVKAITQVLDLIFAVIAWTALVGCIASLAGSLLANIDRKRKDLALLRLMGFGRWAIAGYLMLQAVLLSALAFALGAGLYLIGSRVFNTALGANLADNGFVCRLEPVHLLLAFASALLISMTVAATGGLRALRIEPAESLRQL